MAGINKVMIIGRLGQEPELRQTGSGQAVCTLNVATSENWTDKEGQRQERTEWHRIVIWGRQAENAAKYLAKGRQVYVEVNFKLVHGKLHKARKNTLQKS